MTLYDYYTKRRDKNNQVNANFLLFNRNQLNKVSYRPIGLKREIYISNKVWKNRHNYNVPVIGFMDTLNCQSEKQIELENRSFLNYFSKFIPYLITLETRSKKI